VVPPLRERKADIPILVEAFVRDAAAAQRTAPPIITEPALSRLIEHSWPGNIRELRNVVERLAVRFPGRVVHADDLPTEIMCEGYGSPKCPLNNCRGGNAEGLLERMISTHDSFWSAVYDPFMLHDVTREDVMQVVRLGLERTRGSFPGLMQLFNMPLEDMERFIRFLRKHHCVLPQHRTLVKPALVAPKKAPTATGFPQAV
jgi:DNA-binding NtrC family response regulator